MLMVRDLKLCHIKKEIQTLEIFIFMKKIKISHDNCLIKLQRKKEEVFSRPHESKAGFTTRNYREAAFLLEKKLFSKQKPLRSNALLNHFIQHNTSGFRECFLNISHPI